MDEEERWKLEAKRLHGVNQGLYDTIHDKDKEIDEYAALCDRLGKLLEGTANALKGKPAPLRMHDWSDLPEVAADVMQKLEAARKVLKDL